VTVLPGYQFKNKVRGKDRVSKFFLYLSSGSEGEMSRVNVEESVQIQSHTTIQLVMR